VIGGVARSGAEDLGDGSPRVAQLGQFLVASVGDSVGGCQRSRSSPASFLTPSSRRMLSM
jgi:hypothetical protein